MWFFYFHFVQFYFSLLNALIFVKIEQNIHKGKNEVAQNKNGKRHMDYHSGVARGVARVAKATPIF